MDKSRLEILKKKAQEASKNSYSPYSKFKVGAALVDEQGNIFTGCNVENLSFPLGCCAEHTTITKGVSEQGPSFRIDTLVIYTSTEEPTTPCGGCRQVINEFASKNTRVICFCDSNEVLDVPFDQLFPNATRIDL